MTATGAGFQKMLEGIYAGSVAVAPMNSESVGPHQCQRHRPDVTWHRSGIQQRPAAHLLDTSGAGAGQSEAAGGIERLMSLIVPLDQKAVIATVDGVGDYHEGKKNPPR